MSAPHVTGTVALLAAQHPYDSAVQRKARILNNVDTLNALNGLVLTGGRLNLGRSLSACMQNDDCAAGYACVDGYA